MPIEYYAGVPGVSVEVMSVDDLKEALDIIHTQCLDSLGEDHPVTTFMSDVLGRMDEIE